MAAVSEADDFLNEWVNRIHNSRFFDLPVSASY